jgi:hypothetical protein
VIKIKEIQENPTNRDHYRIVFGKKSPFFKLREGQGDMSHKSREVHTVLFNIKYKLRLTELGIGTQLKLLNSISCRTAGYL